MLSKSERKILGQLAELILERDIRKTRSEELHREEKRKNTKKINSLEREIDFFSFSYSNNYKRVLKHRIRKKAEQMVDDLLVILQTHDYLKIKTKDFLSNDKHILLRHYLPDSMTFKADKGGIDVDARSVSLKDLTKDYNHKDGELGVLKKLDLD